MYRLLALYSVCFLAGRASSDEASTPFTVYEHCGNLQPQENIQIKLITGIWYVIEILQHKTDERLYNGEKFGVPTCPMIYLQYLPGSDTELKLHWEEDVGVVEYRFKINDKAYPGFWMSTGAQNGSLVMMANYNQFAGTVHVRKAVSDHMVLTFCSPNTQLYSVVLARDKWLDVKELRSISNHMQRLKLPITQTKLTCQNSASTVYTTLLCLIAALCFTYAHYRSAK